MEENAPLTSEIRIKDEKINFLHKLIPLGGQVLVVRQSECLTVQCELFVRLNQVKFNQRNLISVGKQKTSQVFFYIT